MTPAALRAKAVQLIQAALDDARTELPPEPRDPRADLTAFVDLLIEISDAAIEYYKPSCTCAECRALSRLEELTK